MKSKLNYVEYYKCTYSKIIQISKWKSFNGKGSFSNPLHHIYGLGSICPTITTASSGRLNSQNVLVSAKLKNTKNISKFIGDKEYITSLDIRFITPRECGRLMGVSEPDIDIMIDLNKDKKRQLFMQYGNSIVVDVLYYALRPLFGQDGVNGRQKETIRD